MAKKDRLSASTYADVRPYLSAEVEGFDKLRPLSKRLFNKLVTVRLAPHGVFEGAYVFTDKYLTDVLGASVTTLNDLNKQFGLFTRTDSYEVGNYSKGFYWSDFMLHLKENARGYGWRECEERDKVIRPDDSVIKIDGLTLEKWVKVTPDETVPNSGLFADGYIPQNYHQTTSNGRVFDSGLFYLQRLSNSIKNGEDKRYRDRLFQGYYEYDFKNCHYVILSVHINNDAIHEYAYHPDEVRSIIANDVGCSEKQVKMGLLFLLYGAPASSSPMTAIGQTLGEFSKDFLNHPYVVSTIHAIKQYKKEFGTDARELALFLQREEHKILKSSAGLGKTTLPLFDGWITKENYNVEMLQSNVYKECKYRIKITKREVKYEFPQV